MADGLPRQDGRGFGKCRRAAGDGPAWPVALLTMTAALLLSTPGGQAEIWRRADNRSGEIPGVSAKMQDALYGISDTTATLAALRARLADPQHPVSREERSILGGLIRKQNGLEPSMFDLEAEDELMRLARDKTGQAQLITSFTLLHGRHKPGLADELASRLADFPPHMLPAVLTQLEDSVSFRSAPYYVPLLESPDKLVRGLALKTLLRIGDARYLDMALADMVAPQSRYGIHLSGRERPNSLSEKQQLILANGLADGPKEQMHSALSLLEKCADSKALVVPLRQALTWAQGCGYVRERGEILVILSRLDPAAR